MQLLDAILGNKMLRLWNGNKTILMCSFSMVKELKDAKKVTNHI